MSGTGSAASQDLPPKGGFKAIKYERRIPLKGPSGAAMFLMCGAVMGYGWYNLYRGLDERRELQREKAWSRIHIVPLLIAEADRDEYRRNMAAVARERVIMKDVPGWEAGKSVYSASRYVPTTIANVPIEQQPGFVKEN